MSERRQVRVAEDFEGVTLNVEDVPGVRVLITSGRLVADLAVYAVLAPDDAVDVVFVDMSDS